MMDLRSGKNNRVILHVDLNSFFATAEQQVNPYLRGKPVGVIKALGRTCIIAASVEAKKYGVKTGMRVGDARKLCPQIILVPADFEKYQDMTYRFINICKTYSPLCEVFSLDECFIDVSETEKFWGNVFNIAYEIKERLRDEVGDFMTCSAGISYNRLLAKLASGQIKPDGLFWITADNAIEVLDKSQLTDVCGIGWGLSKHLEALGIESFSKLRSCSVSYLYFHFGPYWSFYLYNIARGIDNSAVLSFHEIADAKSVGRTYTTHRLLTSNREISRLVRNLCEEVAAKARQMNMAGRYVSLSLRGGEESFWGHLTLKNYIDDGRVIFEICRQIAKNWPLNKIIFAGVSLGMLTKKRYRPFPLFTFDQKRDKLLSSIDDINRKYGGYTLFPGQLLGMSIIRPEVTGYFGDKKFHLDNFQFDSRA